MKLRKFIFAFALALSSGVPAMSEQVLTLPLEECIRIALDNSPTVRIADVEVRKSDYSKKETLASLFPQVDFQLAYQRSIELQTIRMDFGGTSQNLKMGSDNSWNTGFTATLPLVAPSLWKAISISDTRILQSLEEARASRIDLVKNVSKSYYALMLAIASREVLNQQYEISKLNAEIYKKQFEQGTASEYDVLRSSVQVSNLEPEILQADIAVRQCQLQLMVLLNLEAGNLILPSSDLETLQSEMRLRSASSYSLESNTSMRQLGIQEKMARQNLTLKKFAFLPTLGASFNLNWNSISNGSPFRNQQFNPYCNVGVALSLPILTGGARYQAVRQAQANISEISLQRENLESSLNMQLQLALDNINLNARQIDSSREGMQQAIKANEIMQKSFEIGAASYLELRDSELARTSARLMYLQAIHNYLGAMVDLNALIGKDF